MTTKVDIKRELARTSLFSLAKLMSPIISLAKDLKMQEGVILQLEKVQNEIVESSRFFE